MDELLELAFDDPEAALARASDLLSFSTEPIARSYAHQARGLALRESGRTSEALDELRLGIRVARASGSNDRVRDVRATYGGSLVMAGFTTRGLHELRAAARAARGPVGARVRMRLALVLLLLGRHAEGVPALRQALAEIEALDDPLWEARTRNSLAYAELVLGNVDVAARQAERAEEQFVAAGAGLESLEALENRGEVVAARGDLAGALRLYASALAGYVEARRPPRFELVRAHAMALLAAGMPDEARDRLSAAVDDESLPETRRADLHLGRARAHLAAGDPRAARTDAAIALRSYRRQHRTWFATRAALTAVQADLLDGGGGEPLARRAREVAGSLDAEQADEAPLALDLAGRLARGDARLDLWMRAAAYSTHPNALVRAGSWHARALAREESGDRGGVLRSAAAGLAAIDEHRRLIGSSELRALATAHGRELTTIALRHAASDPRTLLRWSERTRATALAQPPATSDTATIPASLAALRDNGRRLAQARQDGEATEALERERLRWERAVRAESHTLSATTAAQQRPPAVEEIVAAVGDDCFIELVDVDGTLHVLVVHAGRVRRRVASATAEVAALLAPAQMLLRRASRGRPADLAPLGVRLQEAILGDAARLIPDGPVVLAPTARLHGLAWALLPVLGERPFAVVPSAGQWLRARATPRPRERRTLLVSGPGLATGGAEVPLLAAAHPDAVLLDGAAARLEPVLSGLDGADLVHLAAHGHFRADSPLFSALDLADGPLTVHDLERVRRAPYRVVLSACESGVLAPVGAEELLGLAAALFSLGTAGLVSSVAEVNDEATAALMVGLHGALAAGVDPATALHRVREQAAADPVAAGTAAAFVALGV